jgi:hypothetical protein
MPTHNDDPYLIQDIKQELTWQITANPTSFCILVSDFNRDIALIGRHTSSTWTPPQPFDHQWRAFLVNLDFQYIPTSLPFTRQGGDTFSQTSLIDGFFLRNPNSPQFHSHTILSIYLNSDHLAVSLYVPPNTLLSRPPQPDRTPQARIPNPIPPEKIELFNTLLCKTHNDLILRLTTLLHDNEQLTPTLWQTACTELDSFVTDISRLLYHTCA